MGAATGAIVQNIAIFILVENTCSTQDQPRRVTGWPTFPPGGSLSHVSRTQSHSPKIADRRGASVTLGLEPGPFKGDHIQSLLKHFKK